MRAMDFMRFCIGSLIAAGALLPAGCGSFAAAPEPGQAKPPASRALRIATFNVALGLPEYGDLARALEAGDDPRLVRLAAILQAVRPDILLLNEFDYDPRVDAAGLLNRNYLAVPQAGEPSIALPHHFRAPVNTGVDSGLDLDGNGRSGEPEDAWGYGRFAGQYGMLVLSRFPIDAEASRTFQRFPWSALPHARRPLRPDGSGWHADDVWQLLRLSSKSHWDVVIEVAGRPLHLLAFHPTPPVFDGPEDRNGRRNHDEILFWAEYLGADAADFIVDDQDRRGGLASGARFIVAGDFNADPLDGDSVPGAIGQLLDHPRIDARCLPVSAGGRAASSAQGGVNDCQRGDPAADTSDFDDTHSGNLRLDYLLPARELTVSGCGVFWPAPGERGADRVTFSDHRLVWLDVSW
jgi:endonuclease/exonuclease/phosphatase family metal-dependent hydrolase